MVRSDDKILYRWGSEVGVRAECAQLRSGITNSELCVKTLRPGRVPWGVKVETCSLGTSALLGDSYALISLIAMEPKKSLDVENKERGVAPICTAFSQSRETCIITERGKLGRMS